MPGKTNDTTAAAAATEPAMTVPAESAHHPYCTCGTHGSHRMIAGLLIGLFLLASAFVSGVIAGKISDRFGGHGRAGMMGGYGQSYCDRGGSGYEQGITRNRGDYGQGMMRGYHGYGYQNGTTDVPDSAVPDTSTTTAPAAPAPTTPAQ